MNYLGLMSGSSLDGLDMALCNFDYNEDTQKYIYKILEVYQAEFPEEIVEKFSKVTGFSGIELLRFSNEFAVFCGETCKRFIDQSSFNVDAIGSHGHTVFHFPQESLTYQLGNGAIISQISEREVICDFRTSDIASGGIGAPFAPIIDFHLFPNVDILVNLGGISNASFRLGTEMKATDISPCNQLLNFLARKSGLDYDKDGIIASGGEINNELLDELHDINRPISPGARAIDNTWVETSFFELLDSHSSVKDGLRTCVEFIVSEIISSIESNSPLEGPKKMMVTGGGAFNKFLIGLLEAKSEVLNVKILPINQELINYKEALLISFMAYLRKSKIPNVINSVTGAARETIGGAIYTF